MQEENPLKISSTYTIYVVEMRQQDVQLKAAHKGERKRSKNKTENPTMSNLSSSIKLNILYKIKFIDSRVPFGISHE